MPINVLAAILLAVGLYSIALGHLWHSPSTWQQIGRQLLILLPILVGIVLVAAFLGFCIGGRVGLIGNSLSAAIWLGWLFLMKASQPPSVR